MSEYLNNFAMSEGCLATQPTTVFGRLLRAYRRREGLSQTALATRAQLGNSHVSRLESGDRQPSRDTVLALAQALRLNDQQYDRLLVAAGLAPTWARDARTRRLVRQFHAARPAMRRLVEQAAAIAAWGERP